MKRLAIWIACGIGLTVSLAVLSVVALKAANKHTVFAAEAAVPSERSSEPALSTVCKFTIGPRVGTTQDFSNLWPGPIGRACKDGAGNRGVVAPRGPSPNLRPFPPLGVAAWPLRQAR